MSDLVRDVEREIAAGLHLRIPSDWRMQDVAGGKQLEEPGTGVKLRIFSKLSPQGAVSLSRFGELGLAHLMKTLPGCEPVGDWQAVEGAGWQGRLQIMSRACGGNSQRLLYVALIREAAADSGQQDNISVLLEVPEPVFAERASFFRFLVPARLQVGEARNVPAEALPAKPVMSLELQPAVKTPYAEAKSLVASPAGQPIPDPVLHAEKLESSDEVVGDDNLYLAARGQKLVVYAIALNFVLRAIENSLSLPVPLLLLMGVLVVAVTVNGVIKICSGLGHGQGSKIAFSVASVFPLINLVVLIFLSVRTTRVLREAGFEVGLLGARL